MQNRQEFDIQSQKISQVTVYNNRAEIKRVLETEVKTSDDGKTEIVVKNLPQSIIADSVRVDGKGAATIVDVKFEEKRKEKKEWNEERKKLEEMRTKRQHLYEETEDWRCLLSASQYALKMAHGMDVDKNRLSCPTDANEAKKLRDQYMADRTAYREQLAKTEGDMSQMNEEIGELARGEYNITARQVSILLADIKEDGRVELTIRYMVDRASWTPSYDIRVIEKKMTMIYYGLIKQDSGEKWSDVEIYLSTATPSVCGQIRKLERSTIEIWRPNAPGQMEFVNESDPRYAELCALDVEPAMTMSKMEVIRDAISISYQVQRQSTIECDGAEHKLTIAQIDLTPIIEYQCVPCKEPAAYVIAQATNTSSYQLLAGSTSIFSGNSFVCNGHLDSVPPNGHFSVSMGVEIGIKIDYKPLVEKSENAGIFSTNVVRARECKIVVKNLRSDSITLVVQDRYPMTKDDDVRVPEHLVEGSPSESFSKDNGLVEWKIRLDAGEEKTLSLRYKIEYPRGAELKESEE